MWEWKVIFSWKIKFDYWLIKIIFKYGLIIKFIVLLFLWVFFCVVNILCLWDKDYFCFFIILFCVVFFCFCLLFCISLYYVLLFFFIYIFYFCKFIFLFFMLLEKFKIECVILYNYYCIFYNVFFLCWFLLLVVEV